MKDLRKAHFHFGSAAPSYETTNKQVFVTGPQVRSQTDLDMIKNAQSERQLKMRQQNFSYGKDQTNYLSMAKKDFP